MDYSKLFQFAIGFAAFFVLLNYIPQALYIPLIIMMILTYVVYTFLNRGGSHIKDRPPVTIVTYSDSDTESEEEDEKGYDEDDEESKSDTSDNNEDTSKNVT